MQREVSASGDVIESALAEALKGAADAGRFDVVARLAGELEARRLARASPEAETSRCIPSSGKAVVGIGELANQSR
jgi:thiazole synthase ThiGH ThiG subunit